MIVDASQTSYKPFFALVVGTIRDRASARAGHRPAQGIATNNQ